MWRGIETGVFQLSGVKAEAEDDEEEIIFEEVECDVADTGYSEDIDQAPYNALLNGGKLLHVFKGLVM